MSNYRLTLNTLRRSDNVALKDRVLVIKGFARMNGTSVMDISGDINNATAIGATTTKFTFDVPMYGLAIRPENTTTAVKFTVNAMTIPAEGGFEDAFDPFTALEVDCSGAYMLVVKG